MIEQSGFTVIFDEQTLVQPLLTVVNVKVKTPPAVLGSTVTVRVVAPTVIAPSPLIDQFHDVMFAGP